VNDDDPSSSSSTRLLVELRGSPRAIRRALSEVEDHLREAMRDGVARVLTQTEAARARPSRASGHRR
jgi:hypothetical protein